MISKLVRFSINYRWLIILMTALMALVGWVSFKTLPIDAVPDITNVQVQVNTAVEAIGPEEIERTVTLTVETALNGIPGVTQVRSLTRFGLSQVTVVFEDHVDIFKARQLVSERLQTISGQLPANAHPRLGPVSTGLGEIYHYVLEANTVATGNARIEQLMEIRAIQDWVVKPRLLSVKGVAEVNTIGGFERQYHIEPSPQKMAHYGIHFSDIEEAIEKANQNTGGGYVEQTADQFLVQGNGLFKSIQDIKAVPIKSLENFKTISIGDIATVHFGKELRTGAALHNGREVVIGTIMMLSGENSRTVSLRVSDQIKVIQQSLPKGYKIVPVYNRSELVNATLGTVTHNLITGAVLVIIILFLLVGNIRAAVITAIVIPLSLLFTFILMKRFGISGNLVSLGALDFGIIVDGAVIVLDNCVRHVHDQTAALKRKLTADEVKTAVFNATVEIRKSAGFGELIIVVAFLPIFAFVGIEGKMFMPMAATFIFAILGALILSFTLVPALASLLLRGNVVDKEPWLMRLCHQFYKPALNWSLRGRAIVLTVAIASVILGGVLFSRLGGEFLPRLDEGSIVINIFKPPSVGLSHSVRLEEKTQEVILQIPEVDQVFSRIGTAEIATDPMGPNVGDTFISFKPKKEWPMVNGKQRSKADIIADMQYRLDSQLSGQGYLISQPIQFRFNELMEGTRADVSLKLFGEDQAVLAEMAQKIVAVIETIPGAGDVEMESKGTVSVLEITPKSGILQELGISNREVLETVSIGMGGDEVGVFYDGLRRFPIVVRLGEDDRSNIDSIKDLPVGIGNSTLPLSEVATVRFQESYSAYNREATKRRVAILINPRGKDTESFVRDAQAKITKEVTLPPGYYLEWGGNFKNLQEAKSRLLFLGPVALLLILLMIYAAFRNVVETALIFLCIPFALVGGVLGLMIKGIPFSISAGVGFIALSGIAVLNGVVMVSYFNDLRKKGLSGIELVKGGAMLRLRPVLMTALVDIFGFLPMALSHGLGSEVQHPLAAVIIGGIVSSTLLTLIILPALYVMLEKSIQKSEIKVINKENSL